MARAFKRKGELFVAKLDAAERAVIAGLLDQTRVLLAPIESLTDTGDPFADLVASLGPDFGSSFTGEDHEHRRADPDPERDPALDRLLPDAHRGDPAIAAEFRRLTEQDLRRRKSDNLARASAVLRAAENERVALPKPDAEALLVALTDTRLLLAERLGIQTESDVEAVEGVVARVPDHPLAYAVAVYDFLTWLQDSLAGALMGRRHFG